MKYRFLENIATADVAFEAYGKTLEELFENCALALTAVMVDPKTVKPISQVATFHISQPTIEDLLFKFLSELVYRKDTEQLLFLKLQVKIKKLDVEGWKLDADLWGEKIKPKKHKLRADIKAVTWHMFKIEKIKNGYKAQVILDI